LSDEDSGASLAFFLELGLVDDVEDDPVPLFR